MENQNNILDLYLKELEMFYNELVTIVNGSHEVTQDHWRDLLNQFYSDGWDALYGDGMSFYEKHGNYLKAIDAAQKLGKEEELKNILEKIWQILPEFYEIHQKLGDPVPQIPEKWF